MKEQRDPWYVRLPDGRVMKAKSTSAVKHHIEAGHIPLNSFVRRHASEEWQALAWVQEFSTQAVGGTNRSASSMSDIPSPPPEISSSTQDFINAVKSGVSARLDPLKLQTVGVRGFVEELLAAFDSTLSGSKLIIGCLGSAALFAGMLLLPQIVLKLQAQLDLTWTWLIQLIQLVYAIFVFAVLNTLLSRQTHMELSRMQPVSFGETCSGFMRYLVPVLFATAIIAGGASIAAYLVTEIPVWLAKQLSGEVNRHVLNIIFTPLPAVLLIISMGLWMLIGLCWLLPPAIVVEEASWVGGIREWRALIKEHFGRILVYEALAFLLGLLLSLPLTLAFSMAMTNQPSLLPLLPALKAEELSWSAWVGQGLVQAVHGMVAGPMLAFLGVANVFIYLNLRYEYSPQK